MKDFFGKELIVGDVVALLQKAGSRSVYIRRGEVTGFTPNKVKVKYKPQGCGDLVEETTREPGNLIKK